VLARSWADGIFRLLSCLAASWPDLTALDVLFLVVGIFLQLPDKHPWLAIRSDNNLVCDRLHSTTTAHHHPGRMRRANNQTANHISRIFQKRGPRKSPQCQDELILAWVVSRPALHDQVRTSKGSKPMHSSSTPLLARMRQHATWILVG